MGAFLTYALDEGGALIHVDNVANGVKCGCHCPHCGSLLYAKNAGTEREHHFAHANGHECEGAYESSLHLLAKEIFQETGTIMLPPFNCYGFPTGSIHIRNVEIEKWDDHYKIRPDVEGIMDNGERILIEFYVSHKIDGKKRQLIVDHHLMCLEIDINYQSLDKDELKRFLAGSAEDRSWIVSTPQKPKANRESFSYGRNPIYEKTRDIIKSIFDNGSITIQPYGVTGPRFDLRQVDYDVCEVITKYRGLRSDLLLYRSKKEKQCPIAISFRGRCRNMGFRYPKGLRIIDVIFGADCSTLVTRKINKGNLFEDGFIIRVEYYGFKKRSP